MAIIFNEKTKTFHLYNEEISYLMTILPNGHPARPDCDFDPKIYVLRTEGRP